MKYKEIIEGKFLSRPNRFIANVDIEGEETVVHVKNTGRCSELLSPGCTVYLSVSHNPLRKTKYDLIAAVKNRDELPPLLINLDSQAPNEAAEKWLKKGILFSDNAVIKREVKHGKSRFDFYIEDKDDKIFLEVKGVTQENHSTVLFPDAPTQRGLKHLQELSYCINEGYKAYVLFVIQMKGVDVFRPNAEIHPEFAEELRVAHKNGVRIIAMDCIVTPDSMEIDEEVPVEL